MIGLGTGTLSSFGREGDLIRFYEIDPDVIRLAHDTRYFTYLRDAKARVEIVEGDGRLSLERELAEGKPGSYDILIMDAFSSDSIPVHLISKEAIELYLKHLKPDGLLVFNISNQFIDLESVLAKARETLGLNGAMIRGKPEGPLDFPSRWVILSRDDAFLGSVKVNVGSEGLQSDPSIDLWTDDYSNLFQVLR